MTGCCLYRALLILCVFICIAAGTVCLSYPPVTLNPVMDHTKAIGLDRIHDIFQSASARESIETGEIGATGPIILVQDSAYYSEGYRPHEALIYWTPIYDERFDLVTDDGVELKGYWGFAGVLLDWHNVMREVGLYDFFEERNMRFALVEILEDRSEKVVESTEDDEPTLTRETAEMMLPLYAKANWMLLVDVPPPKVGDPAFAIWGSFLVLFAASLLSLALMLILVSRKDHEELLCRCIPRNIVRRLHAGETVIEKYDMATICYIDIVSFTTISGRMKAHEVMEMLQVLFREFDRLAEKHNCLNCETIGDAVSKGSTVIQIWYVSVVPLTKHCSTLQSPVVQRETTQRQVLPTLLHLPSMQSKS